MTPGGLAADAAKVIPVQPDVDAQRACASASERFAGGMTSLPDARKPGCAGAHVRGVQGSGPGGGERGRRTKSGNSVTGAGTSKRAPPRPTSDWLKKYTLMERVASRG